MYVSGEEVRANKRNSVLLVGVFILSIAGLAAIYGYMEGNLFVYFSVTAIITGIYLLINFLTYRRTIKRAIDGIKVEEGSYSKEYRKLYHLTKGLSVSAGIKMPEVYVIPTQIPNAFATGFTPDDGIVGVTEGLLEMLDDHELEGVLAHEIAHIVNYDIRLKAVGVALGSSLMLVAELFLRKQVGRRSSGRVALVGLGLFFAARLISSLTNMAISRQREYLADATAVRISSYNEGLASALEKIGRFSYKGGKTEYETELGGSNLMSSYIGNHFNPVSAYFSTHPPIGDRVKRLRGMI